MPSFRKFVGGKTLTAKNLKGGKLTGKIVNVCPEVLKDRSGRENERLCIQLEDERKLITVNATNGERLAKAYGDDYDDWIGKPIQVTTHKVMFGDSETDGLLLTPLKDGKKR